jgi:hypothetical protein
MGWWLDLDVVRDTMALNFYFWNSFLFNSGIFSFILLGILVIPLRMYKKDTYVKVLSSFSVNKYLGHTKIRNIC